jgi:inositol oxygenase
MISCGSLLPRLANLEIILNLLLVRLGFPLTGLIHDLGKMLSLACNEPQWAVVGDSHPVGCSFSQSNVFPQYFAQNPDSTHPIYSTVNGVYEPGCGLDKVRMSWGHDEYLYRVLIGNSQVKLPQAALYMIRFHSFYPWHKHGAYNHLTNDQDAQNLKWVLEFNKFDLYSKGHEAVDVAAVKPYYEKLIEKYLPGKLNW